MTTLGIDILSAVEGQSRRSVRRRRCTCGDVAAPERIHEHLPDTKLIASLRYPVDRAYSHYWDAQGKGHLEKGFREVVRERNPRFIRRGRYDKQIQRYLSLFDRNQILVLIHEELLSHPVQSLNRISSFLEVDDAFFQDQSWITEKVNRSSKVRSTMIHRMVGVSAKWMRDHWGFRQLLDIIKWTGAARQIKQVNREAREYPPTPRKLRAELDEYYVPMVQYVEEILCRQIEAWRARSVRPSRDRCTTDG